MKLPKFRFSLRTALIAMALLATALAAWPYLKTRAMNDVAILAANRTRNEFEAATAQSITSHQDPFESALPSTVFPYIVRVVHADREEMDLAKGINATTWKYYFWCFGLKFRLPIKTEISSTS